MLSAYDEMMAEEAGQVLYGEERPIEITLTPPQSAVFNSTSRYVVNVAGRRSGKTHLAMTKLFAVASNNRNQRC